MTLKLKRPLLIGRGAWGRTIERTLKSLGAEPLVVGKDAAEYLRAGPPAVDSIIIASPVTTHHELLRWAKELELPTFVEKPLVDNGERARYLKKVWPSSQPLLCDFTYCWSIGFEALLGEVESRGDGVKFIIDACFGGDVTHSDCHPVWDYGSHVVAMMLLLGANETELKNLRPKGGCRSGSDRKYVFDGPYYTVTVHVGDEVNKQRRLTVKTGYGEVVGCLRGTSWKVGDEYYDDSAHPPLTQALENFLTLGGTQRDPRWGLDLPCKVTEILEAWIPCNMREAVRTLTEETEKLGGYDEEMKK